MTSTISFFLILASAAICAHRGSSGWPGETIIDLIGTFFRYPTCFYHPFETSFPAPSGELIRFKSAFPTERVNHRIPAPHSHRLSMSASMWSKRERRGPGRVGARPC